MLRTGLLALAVSLSAASCGNGTSTEPNDPYVGAGGLGPGAGGFAPGAGGSTPGFGGVSAGGSAQSGGSPNVPAGQLVCGGASCRLGGRCASSGECPASLGDCFSHDGGFDTCSVYCKSKGLACAARACGPDGNAFDPPNGFTWVSYPAAERADCGTQAYPAQFGGDECTTPIWLSPTKPMDDVVRCCCR
jgi:hypothetical protein